MPAVPAVPAVPASAVTDLWLRHVPPHTADAGGPAVVVVDDDPPLGMPLQLLEVVDGPTVLRLSTEHADRLGVRGGDEVDPTGLDVTWDDPDQLHYPTADGAHGTGVGTRRLTARDGDAFAALVAACSDDDVEEAFVELDHSLVVGGFDGDRLVTVASAYAWRGTRLGDIGVLTHPEARGRGHGVATVRSIAAAVAAQGLEPQYRCDVTNTASAALARAAGFRLFACWSLPAGREDD